LISSVALPERPSHVAVISSVSFGSGGPFFVDLSAVTSPEPFTEACWLELVDQEQLRPVSRLPAASRVMAVNCLRAPSTIVAVAGSMSTRATGAGGGAVTESEAVPDAPSVAAVIVADPAPTAVTSPAPLTLATDVLLDVQVIARPASAFPAASSGVAESS
jgi:hypothetical protein